MSRIEQEARTLLLCRLGALARMPPPPALGGDPAARWVDWESQAETRAALIEREREEVEQALRRIEEGRFGICQECGGPLGLQRLRALPEARYCLGCSGRRERGLRGRNLPLPWKGRGKAVAG